MLDHPEKTRELIAILEAAVPFEVAEILDLIEHLARQPKPVVREMIRPKGSSTVHGGGKRRAGSLISTGFQVLLFSLTEPG